MKPLSSISLEEQKRLLHEIQASLALQETLESMIVRVPSNPAEREQLLHQDWERANLGHKINHWAKKIISVKTEMAFLHEAKLSSLKSAIRSRSKGYTDFSRRVFLAPLAEELFTLYQAVTPLIKPVQRVFSELEQLQKIIRHYIERNMQNPKTSLVDLISVEEMKQIFFQTESRQELLKEIEKRLETYLAGISADVFHHMQKKLLPLYGIRNLTLFPFETIFRCFKGTFPSPASSEFEEAQVFPTIEYLEQLFCALYPFRTYSNDHLLPYEILFYLAGTTEGSTAISTDPEMIEPIKQILVNLFAICKRILQEVPLVELIRYYRGDPYYRLMVYQPKVGLQNFYLYSFSLKVFSDFDAFFTKIRFDILEEMMDELFNREPVVEFQYYMNARFNLIPKQGYPGFTHHRSLVVLKNFIERAYKGGIQETIHILNRGISNRVREIISGMLIHAAAIEELEIRLTKFDNSFAPDMEAGKALTLVKLVLDRDPKQQKIYRSVIADKDKEGKAILEKALIHLEALLLGLQTLEKDRVYLKETSRRFPTIESKVLTCKKNLVSCTKALRYLVGMERGIL